MNTVVIAPLDSMVIRPGSEFVTLFARTVNLALGFQRLLGAVWLSVIPRTYFLAAYTAATALFASRIIATHSLALTKSIVLGSAKACNIVWKSKRVRRICKQMDCQVAVRLSYLHKSSLNRFIQIVNR
ncbi:hypothetical protein VDGE_20397 [Verticillium dahliae]|uniref:Uncharacterized protein n=1 Tax=Verticillium dahliae TaxID=27337 RepID=A0A444RM21_VERDA|nr:hypothetical protein VDGE_20397 [Verticillium dahliae]